MSRKIVFPTRGSVPRLLLLDHLDEDGEPHVALIRPGRPPEIYTSLSRAVNALRVGEAVEVRS